MVARYLEWKSLLAMASMLRYTTDPIDLQEEMKRLDDHAESIRREKFIAAKKIQARVRGFLVRKHLRLLHESAITIQRHWRGYCVRIFADRYLVERVHQMWQDYYDRMATRIQTIWRGYWTRKTVLDIPKMRRWLDTVYAKNYETVEDMKKLVLARNLNDGFVYRSLSFRFRQNEIECAERIVERESMQWILFMLFKLHHLLRTKQRPGVITRIDRTRFTFIEEMLKCFEFRRYAGRKVTSCGDCQIDPKPSLVFRGTYYERCEREIRELERSLKAGLVPIFRSYPYDKQEKTSRKLNQAYLEASLHSRFEETRSIPATKGQGICRPREKPGLQNYCSGTNKLYDEIKRMDCHLSRLCIKCPIHGPPSNVPTL